MDRRFSTKLLTLWVEVETVALIDEAAASLGMTRSSFIRFALVDKCPALRGCWEKSPVSNNWREKNFTGRMADANRRRWVARKKVKG